MFNYCFSEDLRNLVKSHFCYFNNGGDTMSCLNSRERSFTVIFLFTTPYIFVLMVLFIYEVPIQTALACITTSLSPPILRYIINCHLCCDCLQLLLHYGVTGKKGTLSDKEVMLSAKCQVFNKWNFRLFVCTLSFLVSRSFLSSSLKAIIVLIGFHIRRFLLELQALAELLPLLKKDGHRVLIFSQWTSMLDILEWMLEVIGVTYRRLDGRYCCNNCCS